jgi:hypothetical protein
MATDRGWHERVMQALKNAIELLSPGALTFAVGEDGHVFAVAPSLLQQEDKEDGDVFSFFDFDVANFAKVFDAPPEITWRTYPDSALMFEGAIDGQEALVHVFEHPFEDAQPVGVVSKNGDVHELPAEADTQVERELESALAKQVQAFREKFGRDPGPRDPIFFDPDAEVPTRLDPRDVTTELVAAGYRTGLPPAYIHAIEKTGLIVTETNMHLLSEANLKEWQTAVEEGEKIFGAPDRAQTTGGKDRPN